MARASRFRRHVVSGYAVIILLLSLPAAVAIGNAWFASQFRERVIVDQLTRLQHAETLARREAALTTAVWTYTLAIIDERRQGFMTALDALATEMEEPPPALVGEVEAAATAYLQSLDRLIEAQNNGSSEAVRQIFKVDVVPDRDVLIAALDAYALHLAERVRSARQKADLAFGLMIIIAVMAFVLAIAASIWFARRSVRVLRAMYEREQDATARARQAVADRDELQGVLAHDLRNPLNTIALQAEVVAATDELRTAHRLGRSIGLVTTQLGSLLQTLLDVGRLREGRFSVDPRPVPVAGVLRDTVAMFEVQLEKRRLKVELPDDGSKLEVMAERDRLVQVLSNLVGNAVKFTPPPGRIVLAARADGDMVEFAVTDSGPGVPPGDQERVFDRYFTASNGDQSRGTGLGLYISRSIVDAHGGRIWVESVPGNGATFRFTMPRHHG